MIISDIDKHLYDHYIQKEKRMIAKVGQNPKIDITVSFLSQSVFQRGIYDLILNRNYSSIKQFFFTGGLLYLYKIKLAANFAIGTYEYCKILLCGDNKLIDSIYKAAIDKGKLSAIFLLNYIYHDDWESIDKVYKEIKYKWPCPKVVVEIVEAFRNKDTIEISSTLNKYNSNKLSKLRARSIQEEEFVSLVGLSFISLAERMEMNLHLEDSSLINKSFLAHQYDSYSVPYKFLHNYFSEYELAYKPGDLAAYDKSS